MSPPSPRPPPPAVRLLLSAPIAAYISAWYAREAVHNWLDFTDAAHVVVHMDRANANFSSHSIASPSNCLPEWRWMCAEARVLVNPLRLFTNRRTGSLLAVHVHNYAYARHALEEPPSHFLFLASNCFFVRPGVEAFIATRQASAAIRACPEKEKKLEARKSVVRCHDHAQFPWFDVLNGNRGTASQQMAEGQFYPSRFLSELHRQLEHYNARGRVRASGEPSLLEALPQMACTAEEHLLPAVVMRAHGEMLGQELPPTESILAQPESLTANAVVTKRNITRLIHERHTPQLLCTHCKACPDPRSWPQTKFLVKRVPADWNDSTGVRALIARLLASHGRHRPIASERSADNATHSGWHRGAPLLGVPPWPPMPPLPPDPPPPPPSCNRASCRRAAMNSSHSASRARPTTASRARPTTTSRARPTTTSRAKPTTASRARPTTTSRAKPTTAPRARPTARSGDSGSSGGGGGRESGRHDREDEWFPIAPQPRHLSGTTMSGHGSPFGLPASACDRAAPLVAAILSGPLRSLLLPAVHTTIARHFWGAFGGQHVLFAYLYDTQAPSVSQSRLRCTLGYLAGERGGEWSAPSTVRFHHPDKCRFATDSQLHQEPYMVESLARQLATLRASYDRVTHYERTNGVRFTWLLRTRTDAAFLTSVRPHCQVPATAVTLANAYNKGALHHMFADHAAVVPRSLGRAFFIEVRRSHA